jgi:hypothetical protein
MWQHDGIKKNLFQTQIDNVEMGHYCEVITEK